MKTKKNAGRLLLLLLAAVLLLALPLAAWAAEWQSGTTYSKGAEVTYGGRDWVSNENNNKSVPGTGNAWGAPTWKSGKAYDKNAVVSYGGKEWVSQISDNMYTPNTGSAWKEPLKVTDDSLSVNKVQLQSGKVNLGSIQMTGGKSEKFVMIEKGAMEYAADQGMNIGITTNNLSVSFPASVIVNAPEWQKAKRSAANFNFIMEIDDESGLSLAQALSAVTQGKLGVTAASPEGLSFEFYLRGTNQSYTYLVELAEPMTLTYNYQESYRGSSIKPAEKSLALVWADVNKKKATTTVTDVLLDSLVDTNNHTITVKTPYVNGAYVLVGQNGADNTKTTLSGQTGATAPTGEVNVNAVPSWAAASVAQMQSARVVASDLSGKNFNAPISRAEFAAYIVRLLGVSAETTTSPFLDVASDNPYYSEILAANKAGLVAGRTGNSFAPNASITRQEMAVLFARALAYTHVEASADLTKLNAFADAAKLADWAKPSVAMCVNSGLIAGRADGFAPLENTSWTEAVVMLARLDALL